MFDLGGKVGLVETRQCLVKRRLHVGQGLVEERIYEKSAFSRSGTEEDGDVVGNRAVASKVEELVVDQVIGSGKEWLDGSREETRARYFA